MSPPNADPVPLAGEWTIHAAAQQREALLAHLAAGASRFDAAGITEFDTAGLQLLLAAGRTLAQRGLELELLSASTAVRSVLAGYRLDDRLHPLTEEAA